MLFIFIKYNKTDCYSKLMFLVSKMWRMTFLDAIAYYKVILVPVKDTWQHGFVSKLLECYLDTERVHSKILCGIADTKHRDSFTRDEAMFAQHLKRILTAIVLGYHAKTCRTAVC